jgi:hypothetical protein
MIAIGETTVEVVNGLPVLVTREQDIVEITPTSRTVTPMFRREVIGATPELAGVEIAAAEFGPDCWHVTPVWAHVDRPDTGGISVRGRKLADRLRAAIRDGKAITGDAVLVDVNGRTYVDARHHVLSRMLNADLRRLGY